MMSPVPPLVLMQSIFDETSINPVHPNERNNRLNDCSWLTTEVPPVNVATLSFVYRSASLNGNVGRLEGYTKRGHFRRAFPIEGDAGEWERTSNKRMIGFL